MTTSISLISEPDSREFTELIDWLHEHCGLKTTDCYPDIPSAISGIPHRSGPALTLVLQTWSDQYTPDDIDRLIGATLYSEVICVYGTWCEGDGRSRPVWPHATRVSGRYAQSTISSARQRLQSHRPPLPATASRDEAFLLRQPNVAETGENSRGTALVVSPDRVLRQTWADLLKLCGWDARETAPDDVPQIVDGRFDMVVHDLDPGDAGTRESLNRCRTAFKSSRFVGIASLPGDVDYARVIIPQPTILPKMDPLRSIERLMREAA